MLFWLQGNTDVLDLGKESVLTKLFAVLPNTIVKMYRINRLLKISRYLLYHYDGLGIRVGVTEM